MTNERRRYHHGNLAQALVDAATELARRGGPDAVVVREASRQVGVSHNAAYRHFPDRDSLLGAVAMRCVEQLAALMQRLIGEADASGTALQAARARLTAVGRAYIEFAISEPGLFRTAFVAAAAHAPPGQPEPELVAAERDPFAILSAALDELDRAGGIAAGSRPYAEHVAWAAVHGFSMLTIEGPLRELSPQEREAALERLFATIEHGLSGTEPEPRE